MRRALLPLVLAACTAPPAPEAPSRDALAEACAAVVAEHVGKPEAMVETTFREVDPSGVTVFAVRDGARVHDCRIDAAGRVLRLDHV
jgi:phenylpyruvate tautomerase PptA (4-oxalocrotonate tautomerase family)